MDKNITKTAEAAATPTKLERMMSSLMDAANNVVVAINDGKPQDEVKVLKDLAKTKLNQYNSEVEKTKYHEWEKAGDPVKTGILEGYIDGAKSLRYTLDVKTGNTVYEITANERYNVDLPMMEATLGAKVFAKEDWLLKVQALAYLVGYAINKAIDGKVIDYGVQDAATTSHFSAEAKIDSSTSMQKALQEVVDSILFVDDGKGKNSIKMKAAQWNFVREAASKYTRRKRGVLTIASYRDFLFTIMDMMKVVIEQKELSAEMSK